MEVTINKNNQINIINFSKREGRNCSLEKWNSPVNKKLFLKSKDVLFNSQGEVIARFEAEPHIMKQ